MDNAEIMHIPQAIRDVDQLNGRSARLLRGQATAYKLGAIHVPIPLDKLVDVPVFHPLGNHRKLVFAYRHSKKW